MAHKTCSIGYNTSVASPALTKLVEAYGDSLERLPTCEKLHILAVLGMWQAGDTEFQECEESTPLTYSLAEAIEDHPFTLSSNTLAALELLNGIKDESSLDLMVAIAHQLKDGV